MSLFRKKPNAEPTSEEKIPAEKKASINLRVLRPQEFRDVLTVADALLDGYTVVMNLSDMDPAVRRPLLHFVNGVIYALDGGIKPVTHDGTYIVTPGSVSVSEAEETIGTFGMGEEKPESAQEDNPLTTLFSHDDK